MCAAVCHQWLHEYCPLKRQFSLACRLNTYLWRHPRNNSPIAAPKGPEYILASQPRSLNFYRVTIDTRCDQKITVIFIFRDLHIFDFRITFSVMWVHMSVIYGYADNISHFGMSVCFWQIIRLIVFWCALRFFTIRKNGSKELH